MNVVEICIAFVVAIVSVGTPLVFQVISRVDEKYHSKKISDLLDKMSKKKIFQYLVVMAAISVAFYICISIIQLYTSVQYHPAILKFASFLLIVLTSGVVGFFIHFTFTAIKFSNPSLLIELIIAKNKKEYFQKNETMDSFFDFSLHIIREKDFDLFHEKTINHFIDILNKFKKEKTKAIPNNFFQFGFKITKELTSYKKPDFNQFKYLSIDYLWVIENLDENEYFWLWRNLRTAVENKEDEMVYYYWKRAFQHIEYSLRIPDSIYTSPLSTTKLNQTKIEEAETKRFEFIHFHYYLGSLLLYENRIECIRRIWNHTNSQPPRYPLLPSAVGEIFTQYFGLSQVYDKELWKKAAQFNFPRNDGINFDWVVNGWIRKYLILLFLRLYTLHEYYSYHKFLAFPKLPDTQAEKKHWIDNIQEFRNSLEEILTNADLLKGLRLEHITKEWCEKEGKTYPLEYVDGLKSKLDAEFKGDEITQPISQEKEKKFWDSSREIIENAIEEYKAIVKSDVPKEDGNWHTPFYIAGGSLIASKSDFADNQGSDHLNYDSFLAERVANNMRWVISETFLNVTTQGYLLKEEYLFPAIDTLIKNENPDHFVIISFRNNIEYYTSVLNVQHLTVDKYREVDLINIWNCSGHIVGQTLFVLQKSDLPYLIFEKPASKWGIPRKDEEIIIKDKNISASIIDLYANPKVIEQLEGEGNKEYLNDKVLVAIEMTAQISWKKNAKVIALQVASAYENRGIPNKLEEIKPFDEI